MARGTGRPLVGSDVLRQIERRVRLPAELGDLRGADELAEPVPDDEGRRERGALAVRSVGSSSSSASRRQSSTGGAVRVAVATPSPAASSGTKKAASRTPSIAAPSGADTALSGFGRTKRSLAASATEGAGVDS